MKLLSVTALLLASFIAFSECISFIGKRDYKDFKVGQAPSIHLNVKKHHHHNHHQSMLRGKHLDLNEGGFHAGRKSKFDDKWMSLPKKSDSCTLKCGHKEFCLRDSKTGDEKCISKHDFKESRRLFRDFHKEKQILKHDKKDFLDSKLSRAEHMQDVYELIDEYNKKHDKKVHMKHVSAKTLDETPTEVATDTAQECRPTELYELRKRMVGWFVLLHTESRRSRHKMNHKKHGKHGRKYHKKHYDFMDKKHKFDKLDFMDKKINMKKADMKEIKRGKRAVTDTVATESHKCKCAKSVMWEFRKQDKDRNRILSDSELEVMAANRREPCMKPLLKSCDTDADGALTHGEWCCCMAYTIPPCLEKKRLTDPKDWVPQCDKEGFYKREQCHKLSGYCWCVDINGNEIVGTKKLGGGHCGQYDPNGRLDVKKQ